MRYSVLGGGKRLRPVLCLMAAEACGGDPDAALPAACALEMVHTYSLIHDDLPAMDDDDLRRGRPTCHKAFDEATAILAGDGLLTLAFEVIARHVRPGRGGGRLRPGPGRGGRAGGMVGGQMADLQAEGRDRRARSTALEAIHRRKTGALLAGLAADGGDRRRGRRADRCRPSTSTAGPSGLAFQIVDDLLDVQGDEAKLGKRVRQGFRAGQMDVPRVPGRRRQPPPGPAAGRRGGRGAGAAGRRAATGCGRWPWIFWKGTVDEQRDSLLARIDRRPT